MRLTFADNGLALVKFKKSWRQFNAGGVAGFEETDAKMLCRTGYADPYRPPKEEPGADEEPGEITIPDNWLELHHNKLIAIATKLGAPVKTKDEAIAAIEAHLNPDEESSSEPDDENGEGGSDTDESASETETDPSGNPGENPNAPEGTAQGTGQDEEQGQ